MKHKIISLSKAELEKLYRENTNKIVAKQLGVSTPTLMTYIKNNNISLKGKGSGKKKIQIV